MGARTDVWGEPVADEQEPPGEEPRGAVETVTAILMEDPGELTRNPQAASALLYLAGLVDESAADRAAREPAGDEPARGRIAPWRVAAPLALFALGLACMAFGSGILG